MPPTRTAQALGLCLGTVLAAACGSGSGSGVAAEVSRPTADQLFTARAATTTGAWQVPTEDCPDQEAVTAPVQGTVVIGATGPLTGGLAAAFSPFYDGYRAYVDYANTWDLLGDLELELRVEDDQYNPDQTSRALNKLLDQGVHAVSGSLGTPTNLAVRETLNNECVPQLFASSGSPSLAGDPVAYPWTTALPLPYDLETKAYAARIAAQKPGARVALLTAANAAGQVYVDTLKAVAGGLGLQIVSEQTLDPADSNPPTSQVTNLAAARPDAIITIPVGSGCVTFLNELAARKAQVRGWQPETYLSTTCANSTVLRAARESADGVLTAYNLLDVQDPANADVPGVQAYLAHMRSLGKEDIASSALNGWYQGEALVATLQLAQQAEGGLTRESFMNTARNIELTSSVALPGVTNRLDGTRDHVMNDVVQVEAYDAEAGIFTPLGDPFRAG